MSVVNCLKQFLGIQKSRKRGIKLCCHCGHSVSRGCIGYPEKHCHCRAQSSKEETSLQFASKMCSYCRGRRAPDPDHLFVWERERNRARCPECGTVIREEESK